MRVALGRDADPAEEPAGFRALVAKAGRVKDVAALKARLVRARGAARAAYEEMVRAADNGQRAGPISEGVS
jgi:glutamate-ammonia-ligase adenylyltransferase